MDTRSKKRHHGRMIEEARRRKQPSTIQELTKELLSAVGKGDEGKVKAAIARGGRPDVTVQTDRGVSCCLVTVAAKLGHGHLLPALLGAGLRLEGGGTDDRTPLMYAAISCHLGTIETLLSRGADPFATDKNGWTALHFAAAKGCQQCVAALVQHTGNPGEENHDGWTPLDVAEVSHQHEVVEWLSRNGGTKGATKELISAVKEGDEVRVKAAIDRGGRPDVTQPTNRGVSGCLVAIAACMGHSHLLPILLDAGLRLEGGGTDDRTPLMEAAINGHLETIKALLSHGADPLARDKIGWTALHYAAQEGQQQCVAVLVHHIGNPGEEDHDGWTPLDVAEDNGQHEVMEWLAKHGGTRGVTKELISAVREGDEVRVRAALTMGGRPDVTFNTIRGVTWDLVAVAASEGHGHLLPALLDAGLSLEGGGTDDRTPLMYAAFNGHPGTLKELLSRGADPLARDSNEWTALHMAAQEGHHQCVAALLPVTPHTHVLCPDGLTLVHLASFMGHKNVLEVLVRAGWSLTTRDSKGRTPLHCAAEAGNVAGAEFLVQHGVDMLLEDHAGRTPLDLAAECGQHAMEDWLAKRGGLRAVDEAGFLRLVRQCRAREKAEHSDIVSQIAAGNLSLLAMIPEYYDGHVVDIAGLTPLHVAAQRGLSVDKVEALLERGVSPHVISPASLSPADMAQRGGHHQVLKVLQQHQCDQDAKPHMQLYEKLYEDVFLELFTKLDELLYPKLYEELYEELYEQLFLQQFVETYEGMFPQLFKERYKELLTEMDKELRTKMYEKLLTTISEGDDVQQVSRYLCKGAPVEPPAGSGCRSALRLAIITDRQRIVSLLLAIGASLSAGLLQVVWQSPDVTPRIHARLITHYCLRLRAEQRRLEGVSPALVKGINHLLKTIEGDTPWEAAWRWPKGSIHADMSSLLAEAVRAFCPVTATFLHKAKVWSFFSGKSCASALHAALEAGHHGIVEMLIRDLGACPYVPDVNGLLPRHLMSVKARRQLDQRLFEEERARLEVLELSRKDAREKAAARTAMDVQESLFRRLVKPGVNNVPPDDGRAALLLASRKGFPQLIYLLVTVGNVSVDVVVDDVCGTTALHEAASHGQDCCVALLLSNKANPLQLDTYGQAPSHLAAMFGHNSTCKLLAYHVPEDDQDVSCRAGTTATDAKKNFSKYLKRYKKCDVKSLTPMDRHDPKRLTSKLLMSINLEELLQETEEAMIDFTGGEALEVKEAVMKELNAIMTRVSAADPIYRGDLRLVGSSRDGSKLFAPDEYDVNVVIQMDNIHIEVSEREEWEAAKHGKLKLSVCTDDPRLQGNKLMDSLYEPVRRCLIDHPLEDIRLSIVPPGLTSTQVGVGLPLAWQGEEYPLLLVGVDLVPVLEVPWHPQITRPPLTPETATTMQLSNAADGSWRCSFAETEAEVLERLGTEKRLPQLMGKILLSRLKAEPWMPSSKKHFSKWFATREWSIAVPGGFCFKNAFLVLQEKDRQQEMKQQQEKEVAGGIEHSGKELVVDKEKSPVKCLAQVFRLMCADPEAPREDLATHNIPAYFGGDCEGRKAGDGAPLIVQRLEQHLKDSQDESDQENERETDTKSESDAESERVSDAESEIDIESESE